MSLENSDLESKFYDTPENEDPYEPNIDFNAQEYFINDEVKEGSLAPFSLIESLQDITFNQSNWLISELKEEKVFATLTATQALYSITQNEVKIVDLPSGTKVYIYKIDTSTEESKLRVITSSGAYGILKIKALNNAFKEIKSVNKNIQDSFLILENMLQRNNPSTIFYGTTVTSRKKFNEMVLGFFETSYPTQNNEFSLPVSNKKGEAIDWQSISNEFISSTGIVNEKFKNMTEISNDMIILYRVSNFLTDWAAKKITQVSLMHMLIGHTDPYGLEPILGPILLRRLILAACYPLCISGRFSMLCRLAVWSLEYSQMHSGEKIPLPLTQMPVHPIENVIKYIESNFSGINLSASIADHRVWHTKKYSSLINLLNELIKGNLYDFTKLGESILLPLEIKKLFDENNIELPYKEKKEGDYVHVGTNLEEWKRIKDNEKFNALKEIEEVISKLDLNEENKRLTELHFIKIIKEKILYENFTFLLSKNKYDSLGSTAYSGYIRTYGDSLLCSSITKFYHALSGGYGFITKDNKFGYKLYRVRMEPTEVLPKSSAVIHIKNLSTSGWLGQAPFSVDSAIKNSIELLYHPSYQGRIKAPYEAGTTLYYKPEFGASIRNYTHLSRANNNDMKVKESDLIEVKINDENDFINKVLSNSDKKNKYVLTKNLDFSEVQIGDTFTDFRGMLEGNDMKIKNLKRRMFNNVYGIIRNIKIESAMENQTSFIANRNSGLIEKITIFNSEITNTTEDFNLISKECWNGKIMHIIFADSQIDVKNFILLGNAFLAQTENFGNQINGVFEHIEVDNINFTQGEFNITKNPINSAKSYSISDLFISNVNTKINFKTSLTPDKINDDKRKFYHIFNIFVNQDNSIEKDVFLEKEFCSYRSNNEFNKFKTYFLINIDQPENVEVAIAEKVNFISSTTNNAAYKPIEFQLGDSVEGSWTRADSTFYKIEDNKIIVDFVSTAALNNKYMRVVYRDSNMSTIYSDPIKLSVYTKPILRKINNIDELAIPHAQVFDPLSLSIVAHAYNKNTSILKYLTVKRNDVNVNKAGRYKVVYLLKNLNNVEQEKEIDIIVSANNKFNKKDNVLININADGTVNEHLKINLLELALLWQPPNIIFQIGANALIDDYLDINAFTSHVYANYSGSSWLGYLALAATPGKLQQGRYHPSYSKKIQPSKAYIAAVQIQLKIGGFIAGGNFSSLYHLITGFTVPAK